MKKSRTSLACNVYLATVLSSIGLLFRNQRNVRQSLGVKLKGGEYWRIKSFKYLAPVELKTDHFGCRWARACCCI